MNNNESVTICLPVLNEFEVIEFVIQEWLKVIKKLPYGSKILIDDGGSTDGTLEILEKFINQGEKISIIRNEKPDGFGNAAKRLFNSANTHWIFFTDSDGQYIAEDFWLLWDRRDGKDFVRGIKLGRLDPLIRRITSLIWNKSVNFLFELPVKDVNAAFLLYRKSSLQRVLPEVKILPTMVLSELIIRSVLNNSNYEKDIYIRHRARQSGKSRATPGLKLFFVGIKQIRGLFRIKENYRIQNKNLNELSEEE